MDLRTTKSRCRQACVSVQSDQHHCYMLTAIIILYGPRREETCLRGVTNNRGADQPAHLRSLISAFVIRFLESIICKLATGEISILASLYN